MHALLCNIRLQASASADRGSVGYTISVYEALHVAFCSMLKACSAQAAYTLHRPWCITRFTNSGPIVDKQCILGRDVPEIPFYQGNSGQQV